MVSLKTALLKTQNILSATGLFRGGVQIGDVRKAPDDIVAAILPGSGIVDPLRQGLLDIENRNIIVRIYINALAEPEENIEFRLDEIWTTIKPLLAEGLRLATSGIYEINPVGLAYDCVSGTIDQTPFRMLEITIPMLIDDAATVA